LFASRRLEGEEGTANNSLSLMWREEGEILIFMLWMKDYILVRKVCAHSDGTVHGKE
jgi:hypothetical protein